ncbi:MAG TPA: DUF202 domain-containing protein [Hyphomicrobiales bacterium]|nr:DUF202 domain-containing protein [Hyphomicrobiales bacterium]
MSEIKDPRVLFAAERTLLAWGRTSLGFIAFGFVLERSRFFLVSLAPEAASAAGAARVFWLGLAFMALGIFAALYSTRQYHTVLGTIDPDAFPKGYATKGAMAVNLIVAFLGLVLTLGLYVGHP